jgi:Flp pilus assembly protein CpaB
MLERLFATRKGAVAVGLAAAAVALVLLLVYVKQYRHNVSVTTQTAQVLVARNLIQKGTPGNVVGVKHLYELRTVPKDTVRLGALIDPASLRTGVALNDIYPGQQLVSTDFGIPSNVLDTQIGGSQRAISIPIDTSRTLNGQIEAGDHIDIYYSGTGEKNACGTSANVALMMQNVPVISLAAGNAEITLQVNPTEAARLAYATDSGKMWFTLRAKVGVPAQAPVAICSTNLLPANVRAAVTP